MFGGDGSLNTTLHVSVFTGSLLHELSNDGARQQFNSFLDDLILPQMVSSAQVITQKLANNYTEKWTICLSSFSSLGRSRIS